MKKIITCFLILVLMLCMLSACGNKALIDTVYTFDRAVLCMPDGTIVSGEVESWTDYEDGDQIQVKIDGVVYLVHSSQIVLIHDTE